MRYAIRLVSENLLPDWMMFSAATVFDNSTRNSMVSQVHGYASSNQAQSAFAVNYSPATGLPSATVAGINSPAIGAMFSLLALG